MKYTTTSGHKYFIKFCIQEKEYSEEDIQDQK